MEETSQSAHDISSLVHRLVVQYLLGRIVVVDEINEASGVARRLGYHNKVVTVDGQVINAGGSFTGGSTSFERREQSL